MNQNEFNVHNSPNVKHAENELSRNISKFESAMEKLTGRVGETSHSVQRVLDMALQQKEDLTRLKDKATQVLAPVLPYVNQAGDVSRQVALSIRRNPQRYLWTAAGIIGGLIAWVYYKKEETSPSYGNSYSRPQYKL